LHQNKRATQINARNVESIMNAKLWFIYIEKTKEHRKEKVAYVFDAEERKEV